MDQESLSQISSAWNSRLLRKRKTGGSKPKRKGKTVSFRDVAERAGIVDSAAVSGESSYSEAENLEVLLDTVHELGEALKRDPFLGPLADYKRAVRGFLRYVMDHGLALEENPGIRDPKTLKQKKYVLVRVVDERIENLAEQVIKGQADQMEILRRVDEIYGLLVDIRG